MSYDINVWSTSRIDSPGTLPDLTEWLEEAGLWVYRQAQWQIVIGPQHAVELEDVPAPVRATLPGVQYMLEISLEPIGAPTSAYALLKRVSKTLAAAAHGAVMDVQAATVTLPSGIRRYVAPEKTETVDVVELSWFAMNGRITERVWFDALVGFFERELPEALPVRYGHYEPPSHRFVESGRDHLIDFLTDEHKKTSSTVVWFPKRPVVDLDLSLGKGATYWGWQAQRITMRVEANVLQQPGWQHSLEHLWRGLASLCDAFYADIRILRGRPRGGATAKEWPKAERHPVCSWFWAGIPPDGGVAVALGEPYRSLWPGFARAAESDRDLLILNSPNWTPHENVFARVGGVPVDLMMQASGYSTGSLVPAPNLDQRYPSTWLRPPRGPDLHFS